MKKTLKKPRTWSMTKKYGKDNYNLVSTYKKKGDAKKVAQRIRKRYPKAKVRVASSLRKKDYTVNSHRYAIYEKLK